MRISFMVLSFLFWFPPNDKLSGGAGFIATSGSAFCWLVFVIFVSPLFTVSYVVRGDLAEESVGPVFKSWA